MAGRPSSAACATRARRRRAYALAFTIAWATTSRASAAQPARADTAMLSIARITSGPSLAGTTPFAPAWSPDSRTLAFLWHPAGGARTLYAVAHDGTVPRRLLPPSDSAPVRDVMWLPDGRSLLFTQMGALRRLTLADGGVRTVAPLGQGFESLTIAPDGRQAAFLRAGDVWVVALDGDAPSTPRRLTQVAVEPIGTVPLGTYFRREVEIGRATWGGDPVIAWSPDGRTLAVHHVDRRGVPSFGMPWYLGDTVLLNRVRRGAPGTANEVRRIAFVDVASGALTFVPLPDSSSMRVVDFAWNADGVLYVDREQDDATVRTVHLVRVGEAPRLAWRDARATRIYNDIHSAWSADGRTLLLTGDLDDRYRVHRITPGDTVAHPLTPADADVAGPAIARAPSRSVDWVSTAPDPAERHVWRVDARGGAPRRLTTMPGVHLPFVSPDGRTIALLSSSDTVPTELYLLDTRTGARERRITVSVSDDFARVPWLAARYLEVPSRTNTPPLRVRLLLPPGADTAPPRPVLFGPVYSNTVRNRWAGTYGLVQQHLALVKGYAVVQVDVRGSTGYGRAFREAFLGEWGGSDLEDLHSVVDWLATQPWADTSRLGIWGSSYGGLLTVYSMVRKPGLFRAGVAGAAAVDPFFFGSDDVAIARTPAERPDIFRRGARQYAAALQGQLLLIHGMQDDVVPFQTVVALYEDFLRAGKDVDFAFAPAATHGWTQRPYYARYLLTRLVDHFDRHLGAPGPVVPFTDP